MADRLSGEQLRMLYLKHERVEVRRIDTDGNQLIVTEADMAARFGHS